MAAQQCLTQRPLGATPGAARGVPMPALSSSRRRPAVAAGAAGAGAASAYPRRGLLVPAPLLRPGAPSRRSPTAVVAQAAAADNPGGGASVVTGIFFRLRALFSPFSDPRCNQQLIALAVGQALCSVATLIHDSYLPIYVHDELGMTTTEIGAVQGSAQFLCQLAKGVSGVAGDVLGSQVRVLVFGTALTLACKPMFAALGGVHAALGASAALWWFFSAKLADRLSKGVREAPTKAVMNELAAKAGDAPDAAYGLRQSLATAGMLVGSTAAAATFALTGQNYTLTFALATIPTALALVWMVQNFREELFALRPAAPARTPPPPPPGVSASSGGSVDGATSGGGPLASSSDSGAGRSMNINSVKAAAAAARRGAGGWAAAASLSSTDGGALGGVLGSVSVSVSSLEGLDAGEPEPTLTLLEKARVVLGSFRPVYWQALAVVAVLYFSRFDASFLSLRAKAIIPRATLPLLTLVNSLIQVTLTAPLARWSGQSVASRNRLLLVGFGLMLGTHACFALPALANTGGMVAGSALLGCHMAATHAITVSMVASYMPTGHVPGVGKLSGTAVSFTDLLLGFVLAASNAVAGVLTDATRKAGLGNTGCFAGGAVACVAAGLLLLVFERWGDLGRDDLVVGKARRKKAA